ncbi:hypothetical protein ACOUH1_17365 [Acinetobacter baumannii]
MSEVLISNLIEYRDVVALMVWWLYRKAEKISVKGNLTFSFGERGANRDDKASNEE